MISSRIGHSLDPLILKIYRILFMGKSLHPNVLTLLGVFFGFIAFILILRDFLILSGLALMISGLFDLMDGAIARNTDHVTTFGGFLDSVLDRYTDLFLMCGVVMYFMKRGDQFNVLMAFIASIGIALVPYAKARAEASRISCNTGLLERPERLFILLCGLLFNILPYAIIVLALFTHITVVQRIIYVKRAVRD
ncbi:MAG: hypothetical protein C0392_01250 [Syntrophus sp. (in: bacteria)]|nr:hypothetical protein [Syntrophus sp. (in: bacteria)]